MNSGELFIEFEAMNGDVFFVAPSHVVCVGPARDEGGQHVIGTSILRMDNGDTIVVKGPCGDTIKRLSGISLLSN